MRKSISVPLLLALSLSACSQSLTAQSPGPPLSVGLPATPLDLRIEQLVPLLNGQVKPEDYFSPTFLAAVPAAQFKAITDGLIAQYGKPQKVTGMSRRNPNGASLKVAFEKAVATIEIDIEATSPNKVIGLVASGFETSNDKIDAVSAEFKALPGTTGFLLAELTDNGDQRIIASHNADRQFAIASTFKLYVLAELSSQVAAGETGWGQVTPFTHPSHSSIATRGWPANAPVTLHTLAAWMISVSDNGATDTLLHKMGREAVERKLATVGHNAPDKALPILSTVEAFALKADPALRARFIAAGEAEQRALLESEKARLTLERIDQSVLGGAPAFIDSIEWFASPNDLLALLRHIRLQRDDRMMEILGINDGLSPAAAKNWSYVGYKGGSEPGVVSGSYLLRAKDGKWYVATASWNDTANEVDQTKFFALMERLVALAPK